MHYYNSHYIARLGERIGRPLKVDLNTLSDNISAAAKVERGRYARLCIELDLQKKIVPRIIAVEQVFNVEYEGLNLICFECGRYGHRKESCPWKKSTCPEQEKQGVQVDQAISPESRTEKTLDTKEPFGPWMFVSKSSKARTSKWVGQRSGYAGLEPSLKNGRKDEQPAANSRFVTLAGMEAEEDEEKDNRFLRLEAAGMSDKDKTELKSSHNKQEITLSHRAKLGQKSKGGIKTSNNNKSHDGTGKKQYVGLKIRDGLTQLQRSRPGKEKVIERDIGYSIAQVNLNGKEMSKLGNQRIHTVVRGKLDNVIQKDNGLTTPNYQNNNQPINLVPQIRPSHDTHYQISEQNNSLPKSKTTEPKPPDPKEKSLVEEEDHMEDASTDLESLDEETANVDDEDQLDEFDVVPETALNG